MIPLIQNDPLIGYVTANQNSVNLIKKCHVFSVLNQLCLTFITVSRQDIYSNLKAFVVLRYVETILISELPCVQLVIMVKK